MSQVRVNREEVRGYKVVEPEREANIKRGRFPGEVKRGSFFQVIRASEAEIKSNVFGGSAQR